MDAWACVDALHNILDSRNAWRGYELVKDTRVLLLGHSNGGQGAWWNAGRYPDRVVAGKRFWIVLEVDTVLMARSGSDTGRRIPEVAIIRPSHSVAVSMTRLRNGVRNLPLPCGSSAHYIDPSLRAVLETALTPDDNDLFLSNLAHIPVLAIHGGDDDNVPAWHGREYVSTLRTWNPNANVT